MQKQDNNNNKEWKNPLASYARFSAIAMQMGVLIAAGVIGGFKLDKYLNIRIPVFTLILSMVSVAGAIWLLIKEVNNKNKKK